jgi:hypothetical protein
MNRVCGARAHGRGLSVLVLAWLSFASQSHAAPAGASSTTGIERPAREPSDGARDVANALLWLPRETAELLFVTTGTAAGLVENEQVVPRVRELLFTRDGRLGVFPTVFVETGAAPNAGARLVASVENVATTLRAGWGGLDANVVESRLRLGRSSPVPLVLSLEGLVDRRTDLAYLGVGQDPAVDERNRFAGPLRQAVYREERERALASAGMRPAPDVELFLSASVAQRWARDVREADAPGLGLVFEPGTVPGSGRRTRITYTELALRLDTRESRSAPAPGLLLEGYAGSARGVLDDDAAFARVGARAAAFLSLYRRTNVLSPKIVLDGLAPLGGRAVPFHELPRQPDFRGIDSRRDRVSAVASLDYRWKVASFFATRLFADAATVAGELRALSLQNLRWAAGLGLDLFATNAELGRIGFSYSPEGVSLLLSFGVSPRFGDRQHRD